MKTLRFFSSGGCGDALIVALKIQKIKQYEALQMKYPDLPVIYWNHYEKHEGHKSPISEIMNMHLEQDDWTCHIIEAPEVVAKEECKKVDGTYLNTKIMGIVNPYLPSKMGGNVNWPWKSNNKKHVVIHESAGRLGDSSRRSIGKDVIVQMAERFQDRRIIIIGGEQVHYAGSDLGGRILNMTGKTPLIEDAFMFINNCSLFIGQDGVLAYYAMMQRKPTIVHYHIPDLISYYFNQEWAYHTIALTGGGNHLESIDVNNMEIAALLDIAEQKDG